MDVNYHLGNNLRVFGGPTLGRGGWYYSLEKKGNFGVRPLAVAGRSGSNTEGGESMNRMVFRLVVRHQS